MCYGIWPEDEIAALRRDGFAISSEDEAELLALNGYWKGKTLVAREGALYDDERLWPFAQSGIVLPPWKSREEGSGGGYAQGGLGLGPGFYLVGVDYPKVLSGGLSQLIGEAEQELRRLRFTDADSVAKAQFLRAVIIAHQAIIRFSHRFADLASRMAATEEDQRRKAELQRIAETCRQVPAGPARTFFEAVQSFWFLFLLVTPSPTAAAGRFDQYMYPYYRRDMDDGKITGEQALELLACLRIKDMQINRVSGKVNRQKNEALAKWHNWTIGGVTPDGDDATNDLTYLILEAAKVSPTPHHTITVRVHERTPEALMEKALEVVRTGIGMPAFVGDQSYIDYLVGQGVPLRLAREYILTGCLDANVPGYSRVACIGMFIVPRVFDIFLHDGVDPNTSLRIGLPTGDLDQFRSFDDFFSAFKQQLVHFMRLTAERHTVQLSVLGEHFPDPVRSSLMTDGIAAGKDMLQRTMPFENAAVFNPIGMINVADSLAAVKQLVYDQRRVSL
ncbi:MAG: formate C-acetyltransferase, partial [Chloroflexota bacterium]|nr:formate C-acetyltransferase [Chloroflexota bacterium]